MRGEDVRIQIFGLSPTGISKYLGVPIREHAIFFILPPAESTKWLGLPLPAFFAYPPLLLHINVVKTPRKVGVQ